MAAIARSGDRGSIALEAVAQGSGEGCPSPCLPLHTILEHSSVLKCYLNWGSRSVMGRDRPGLRLDWWAPRLGGPTPSSPFTVLGSSTSDPSWGWGWCPPNDGEDGTPPAWLFPLSSSWKLVSHLPRELPLRVAMEIAANGHLPMPLLRLECPLIVAMGT